LLIWGQVSRGGSVRDVIAVFITDSGLFASLLRCHLAADAWDQVLLCAFLVRWQKARPDPFDYVFSFVWGDLNP
jgi:hypothetical protein